MFGLFILSILLIGTPTAQIVDIQKKENVELKEAVEIYVERSEPITERNFGNK